MATIKTKKEAEPQTSTALTTWEEELLQYVEETKEQEAGVSGGPVIRVSSSGLMSIDDNPVPNNEIACVVVDSVIENTFYDEDFDPDDIRPPICYAFGRSDADMVPHEAAPEKQCESCKACPQNQFGSAEKGRGKACGNRRRMLVLQAGQFDRSGAFESILTPELVQRDDLYALKVPPTSLRAWAGYAKRLAAAEKRPPFGVVTKISTAPDPKTQYRMSFELVELIDSDLMPALIERHKLAREEIAQPYPVAEPREEKPAKRGKKAKY